MHMGRFNRAKNMDENISRGYIQLGQGSRADRLSRGLAYEHVHPPQDRCHCIYLAMLLAGVGFLLPYNSFIIAVDYFQARYPGTTIVFDMSLIYILVAFLAVIINNLFVETLSLQVRITFGYILSFLTLLFIAVFEIWFEVFALDTGYYVNLLGVAVVAFGCTGAAGLLISTNRILTKALLDDEKFNTVLFFCISIGIVVLCFVIHFVLQSTKFVRFYISLCSNASISDDLAKRISLEPTEDAGLVDMLDPSESKTGKYGVLSLRTPPSSPPADSAFESTEKLDQDMNEETDLWRMSSESVTNSLPTNSKTYRVQDVVIRMRGTTYTKNIQMWSGIKRGVIVRWQVAKTIWPYMICIALAYFVTLCLFPGIESEIVSCRLGSWMPVILMAIFNFFDFIGKILASVPYDWTKTKLVLFSSVRIVLVPLLAMCAAPRGNPLLQGDGWAMVLSMLLGLSNGVFGSVPMIMAPSTVPDEQKELTGNIMTISYTLGLTTGSGIAYLIDYILGPPLLYPCAHTPSTTMSSTTFEGNSTDLSQLTTAWTMNMNITTVPEYGMQNISLV